MKNKKLIIASGLILLILIVMKILLSQKINIDNRDKNWASYDLSIKKIKENMDEITEPNENFFWWTLKDFDIEDKEYMQTLNSLVADVRMCYLNFTDNKELYTNSNPIRKYREKDYITNKELERLNDLMYVDIKYCLDKFGQYNNTILISEDEETKNRLLSKMDTINELKESEMFNKNATYNELLLRKTIEVHLIEDLSDFISSEYTRLKN